MNDKIGSIYKDPWTYANTISVDELADTLRQLSYYYYNTNKSLVSDEIFDILHDQLAERDPKNPFLSEVGAKIIKEKVKLPYFMPSLDKIKPDKAEKLVLFSEKFSGPFVVSDKMDGVSGLLIKKKEEVFLYTRGDGTYGQNISHLIKSINIDPRVMISLPEDMAIRGELIISKKNFHMIEDRFSNARNTVSGQVVSKKYDVEVAALIDFVAYNIIHPLYNVHKQMLELGKVKGLTVVPWKLHKEVSLELLQGILLERKKKTLYEIDGIVISDASNTYDNSEDNPDYAFAFKMNTDSATVKVIDILWSASKHGLLKPRVQIPETLLGGVNIQYITAYNAKYVVDNKLGPGSVIRVIRSGDVIPKIEEIVHGTKAKLPNVEYKWSGTDIILSVLKGNNNIIIKQLVSFFKILDVPYLSEGIITKLVHNGYKKVIDIISAKAEDLYKIEGLGKLSVDKIMTNIKSAFEKTSMARLMAASGLFGRGIGERKIVELMNEGLVGTNTEKQYKENMEEFNTFYKKLEAVIALPGTKKKMILNKNAVTYVFTGFRDKDLKERLEKKGNIVADSFSKHGTNILVVKNINDTSRKIELAKKKGIKILALKNIL